MDEGESDRTTKTFSEYWGWFSTIYQLSKTNILKITGDKSVTEVNFIFTLNYLGIDKDWNNELIAEQKRAEQEARQKVRLK